MQLCSLWFREIGIALKHLSSDIALKHLSSDIALKNLSSNIALKHLSSDIAVLALYSNMYCTYFAHLPHCRQDPGRQT